MRNQPLAQKKPCKYGNQRNMHRLMVHKLGDCSIHVLIIECVICLDTYIISDSFIHMTHWSSAEVLDWSSIGCTYNYSIHSCHPKYGITEKYNIDSFWNVHNYSQDTPRVFVKTTFNNILRFLQASDSDLQKKERKFVFHLISSTSSNAYICYVQNANVMGKKRTHMEFHVALVEGI